MLRLIPAEPARGDSGGLAAITRERGAKMGPSMISERGAMTRDAMKTCRARGHAMTRVDWRHEHHSGKPAGFGGWNGYAKCKLCGARLKLETHPAPNSIAVSGESVAINCRH